MATPILSVYDANGNKIPIPAIKGDKGDKGDTGATGAKGDKGDKGDPGSLLIKGYFGTLTELGETVLSPSAGDTYGVGAQAPYHIYIYDALNAVWVDNGTMQGVKGDKGDQGDKGDPGEQGAAGRGISGITKISTIGKQDTYSISFTDGTSSLFTVVNGSDGAKGDTGERGVQGVQGLQGIQGVKGDQGETGVGIRRIWLDGDYLLHIECTDDTVYTLGPVKGEQGPLPVKGSDYWTQTDKNELVSEIIAELGQGASLSLTVVNGLEEPEEPTENMLWVKSETAVPKWTVSSRCPETGLVNGQVWFRELYMPLCEISPTGSNVSFSIAQCRQYVDGAWLWQDCAVYTDGEWQAVGTYLFKSGTGWNGNFGGYMRGAWTEAANHEYFSSTTNGAALYNSVKINPDAFQYVFVDLAPNTSSTLGLCISTTTTTTTGKIKSDSYNGTRTLYRMALDDVTDPFHMLFLTGNGGGKIYNIWLC